jgi:predicted transglutaminase-like cysteine proteinase
MKKPKSVAITPNKEVALQQKFQAVAKELEAKIAKYKAVDPATVNVGVAIVKEIQFYEGEIEDIRTGMVKPHNDYVGSVNALAKSLKEPLTQLKKLVNDKVKEYNDKVLAKAQAEVQKLALLEQEKFEDIETARLEREAEEKAIRAEEDKKKSKLTPENKEKLDEAREKREAAEDKLRIEEEIKLVKSLSKKSDKIDQLNADAKVKGMQKRWTFRIIEADKINRAFCSPDSVKINAAIKTGLRQADGLEIYEDAKII